MTNSKTTKKALFTSMLSLLLCCAMLIGTTFAWFTDSVSSVNNKIVAGNLDVELEYSTDKGTTWQTVDANTVLFDENTLWEPGYTQVVYLRVRNVGTLALKYQLGVNIVSETEGTNVDNEQFKLSDYIKFGVVESTEAKFYANRDEARAAVTDAKIISTGYTKSSSLLPAAEGEESAEYVALVVYMPEETGNEANYKTGTVAPTINLGINLFATQVEAEEDSFGNDYDAGLDPTAKYVSTLEELRAALDIGGTVVLMGDIVELDSANVITTTVTSKQPDTLLNVEKDVVLDLNGHTISLNSSGTTTGSVINVKNATLDIVGDGKIVANDDSDSAGWLNGVWAGANAVVNIRGGEFSGRTGCVLYSFGNGVINIYDGTYIVNTDSPYYDSLGRWLNVNNSDANAYINLYGGTFVNFDFECSNMTEPNHDVGNIAIADGYKGVVVPQSDNSTLGYVVPEDVVVVGDNAELKDAVATAQDGDTIMLGTDVTVAGYAATEKLTIDKAITLDLNGHTLTTECGWGGIDAKGGCTIKNGTINHTGNTAAIKAFQVESIEDVTINVTQTAGKTKGGVVVQNSADYYVRSIKNVTINGATNGIECYYSTGTPAIGTMENVTIDATQNGIYLNGAGVIGKISDCNINGGSHGINAYLANLWHISLDIENSTISGGNYGIDIWDEAKTNTDSTIIFNYDASSTFIGGTNNIKVTLQEEISCTINGAEQTTPCDVRS